MKYVSTRGEAPVIGFADALLAGLARDGGLYVPQEWPQFSAADIRAMRGLSYPDLAVRLLTPFLGGEVSPEVFERLAREAYATFRHPAVCPIVQLGANTFVLELFHGPTLAFKDVAMQLLARLMDHVLAERGAARHHRRRDLGRYRRRGDRRLRRARPHRHLHPVPARPGVAGAAAPDDDVARRPMSMRSRSRALSTTARAS